MRVGKQQEIKIKKKRRSGHTDDRFPVRQPPGGGSVLVSFFSADKKVAHCGDKRRFRMDNYILAQLEP